MHPHGSGKYSNRVSNNAPDMKTEVVNPTNESECKAHAIIISLVSNVEQLKGC